MDIVGYENYIIYPDGKVWSKKTKRYLKAGHTRGYLHVSLWKDNKPKTHTIHRLVALHYIPNVDNKNEIDHFNRDKTDNRVENLRWATRSENNDNKGVRIDNKLGIKNICYIKSRDRYRYQKKLNGEIHHKSFKTLEEAVEYKTKFEKTTTLN